MKIAKLKTNGSELIAAPKKHKDVYKVGTKGNILSNTISDTANDNYEAAKDKYGDALYETSIKSEGQIFIMEFKKQLYDESE